MINPIFERRSIRKYTTKPVESEKMQAVLRAGMYAPSGHNKQHWHFIVVDDRAMIAEYQKLQPYAAMMSEAPILILVCADLDKECAPGYYMADCAAATQNILLEAYNQGLGTCWMGIAPNKSRQQPIDALFGLPPHVTAFCGIAIGYADEQRSTPERYDSEKVHTNKW